MPYNHKKVEKKWAEFWKENKTFTPDLNKAKNPFYALFMFPYPSAEGLHIGNFYAFTCVDVVAKYKKLRGFDVFEPIGFDAFGIHSENYALKIGERPRKMLDRTEENFRKQLMSSGIGCDWTREVDTTLPEYYKWTQWIFTKLFERGLAVQKEAFLNWCPGCKTVLADEQIVNGVCERCKSVPQKKMMKQWFFKITDFSERLLTGLENMDWSEITKSAQKNWIGKSEGAEVEFEISGEKVKVFTTRPDTLFGATYFVLSPEHSIVKKITTDSQKSEVEKYIKEAGSKSDLLRTESKEKTGVFTGAFAVNPVNGEKIPVWIADYVLMGYGTGAIMAVPAHDERDFEFAKKYGLEIKQVVAPAVFDHENPPQEGKENTKRNIVHVLVKHPKEDKILFLRWKTQPWKTPITGGIEEGEDEIAAARREVYEETGYKNLEFVKKLPYLISAKFYAAHKDLNRQTLARVIMFKLLDLEQDEISEEEKRDHDAEWMDIKDVADLSPVSEMPHIVDWLNNGDKIFEGDGININSDFLDGIATDKAKEKIIAWLEEKGIGKKMINYKLRDWCISRQRYWGPPIPIIYCEKCGSTGSPQAMVVPEKDLPVLLPDLKTGWEPSGDGKGPLSKVSEFINVKCPKCGGEAKRETDVMDNFLDSAWYFFRYLSPEKENRIFDEAIGKRWLPVDIYIGGNEHAVLHLMYTRFITMVFHDLGLVGFDNPFKRFRANGMILKDGAKMSKSKGNVINPEEYGEKIGYDALKSYILFLGPMSEDRSFSDEGVLGTMRWVERISRLEEKVKDGAKDGKEIEAKLNKIVKQVSDDFEDQKYNTAVAKLMELTNVLSSVKEFSKETWLKFLGIIAPFLPALAEEMWSKSGKDKSIFSGKNWPEYDPKMAEENEVEIAVQINGKFRGSVKVARSAGREEVEKLALMDERLAKYIGPEKPGKVIFVKDKLVNFVK
ncbi:MAG: class I tRNA ligase family protein [Candidatus Pacebacteria bacterium]|nr:class I tRNA ligase family protein [Candidatus Paceibacterota bacterium]